MENFIQALELYPLINYLKQLLKFEKGLEGLLNLWPLCYAMHILIKLYKTYACKN